MHHGADRAVRNPRRAWFAALAMGMLALPLLSAGAAALGESAQPFVTDVMEGASFAFRVGAGVGDQQEVVQVSCASCGHGWATSVSRWDTGASPGQRTADLRFPSSAFGARGEPRWAQNYTISVGGDAGPAATANVTVHLVDVFLQENGTYEVTEPILFQMAGVPDGSWVTFNVSKWSHTGALKGVAEVRAVASDGVAKAVWRVPAEQAADMDCPHLAGRCRNYTVTAVGAGRVEREGFQAQPAVLNATLRYRLDQLPEGGTVPGTTGPVSYNRTETIHAAVDVRYHNNAPVRPDDLLLAGDPSRNGTLAMSVERVTLHEGAPPTVEQVEPLWAHNTPQGWRVDWHIPKNLTPTVVGLGSPLYRIVLREQQDRWGNVIPGTQGTSVEVDALRITPAFTASPMGRVERLENASATFRLAYADGTPFTNQTNATTMKASLLDASGDEVDAALLRHVGNGTWVMSYQPSIKFRDLGFYTLRILDTRDADGNEVVPTSTAYFQVVPAAPRIQFTTRVGFQERNATQGFTRGEVVDVEATVTYADGRAFNTTHLGDGNRSLPLVVTKLDATGQVRGVERYDLLPEDDAGHWATQVPLPELDDTNPLGPWVWGVQATDNEHPTPNSNVTAAFTRWMHGAPLDLVFTRQPESLLLAGKSAEARFQVSYPRNHTSLDEPLADVLNAEVFAWDGRAAEGPRVALLPAAWDDARAEWRAIWETNHTTLVGDYVLRIVGLDVHGNTITSGFSRPMKVFVDRLSRQVLREPAEEVHRGETALVVFDGAEGDLGLEGEPAPRIEAQKWNPQRQAWEAELRDVRDNATDGLDHLGRLATDTTTDLGLFRFAFFARNSQYAVVHAESRAFRILPVEVPRAWVGPSEAAVAQPVVKGSLLALQLERQEGDILDRIVVTHLGQEVDHAKAFVKPGRLDVSWATGYRLEDGAYALRAYGRDLRNNTYASPPLVVNLTGIALKPSVAAPPSTVFPRAGSVELRASFQYPDQVYARNGTFEAVFVHNGEVVATRALASNHSAWLATWTPPASSPLGSYTVRIRGDDGLGNPVDQEEAFHFQLAEGQLDRHFSVARRNATRMETVTWTLPATPEDREMAFFLRDPASSGARQALPYNLTQKGEYVVAWHPAVDERVGRYVLDAEGLDAQGNALRASSPTLLLKVATIGPHLVDGPRKLSPGQEGRWVFRLSYADGTPIPAGSGTVPRVLMLGGDDKVIGPPTALAAVDGQWVVTWTPPTGKGNGFSLAVGGLDDAGNEIQGGKIVKFTIDEGLIKNILGVPGFDAALAPLALAAVAVALRVAPLRRR